MDRNDVVKVAKAYDGVYKGSKKHHEIIDTFNTLKPDGYTAGYNDHWCAEFVTACFLKAYGKKYASKIMVFSASCGKMQEKAEKFKIWEERDNYKPNIGDVVLYDWDDNGKGNNKGWPDHVGIVSSVSRSEFYVIEGNTGNNSHVGYRKLKINNRYIRGFILPKYKLLPGEKVNKEKINKLADDVIAGKYGDGDERKKKLGIYYNEVQKEVNRRLKS